MIFTNTSSEMYALAGDTRISRDDTPHCSRSFYESSSLPMFADSLPKTEEVPRDPKKKSKRDKSKTNKAFDAPNKRSYVRSKTGTPRAQLSISSSQSQNNPNEYTDIYLDSICDFDYHKLTTNTFIPYPKNCDNLEACERIKIDNENNASMRESNSRIIGINDDNNDKWYNELKTSTDEFNAVFVNQRQSANARERSRTFHVNTAFHALRTLIPTKPANRKLSKIETLHLAISYISHLSTLLVQDASSYFDDNDDMDISSLNDLGTDYLLISPIGGQGGGGALNEGSAKGFVDNVHQLSEQNYIQNVDSRENAIIGPSSDINPEIVDFKIIDHSSGLNIDHVITNPPRGRISKKVALRSRKDYSTPLNSIQFYTQDL
ncbi:unnamed protein product [Gordionus sp. m RMFG-2023]